VRELMHREERLRVKRGLAKVGPTEEEIKEMTLTQ
jgi:hypothetical protein